MRDHRVGFLAELDPLGDRAVIDAQQPTPYLDPQHPVLLLRSSSRGTARKRRNEAGCTRGWATQPTHGWVRRATKVGDSPWIARGRGSVRFIYLQHSRHRMLPHVAARR